MGRESVTELRRLQAENEDLEQTNKRLREALRRYCIEENWRGDPVCCSLCRTGWVPDAPERHAPAVLQARNRHE